MSFEITPMLVHIRAQNKFKYTDHPEVKEEATVEADVKAKARREVRMGLEFGDRESKGRLHFSTPLITSPLYVDACVSSFQPHLQPQLRSEPKP